MTIDFGAEARRNRLSVEALRAAYPRGTMPPLAPQSPLAAYGRAVPPAVSNDSLLDVVARLNPGELAKLIRQRSARGHVLDAPFHSFFHAWPLVGGRSALAVIRHHFMVHIGREPTLDECDRYLRAAVTERLNGGELRFRIAADAGLAAPDRTLSRGQALQRGLAGLARGLGVRSAPFGFQATALAFDGFVLDAMRLASAVVHDPQRDAPPERV